MEKQSSVFILLGYFYIILPIVIFLFGYCNLPVALIITVLIITSSYFIVKECPKIWIPQNKKEWVILVLILLFIIILVYFSGIGAYSYQNSDHKYRNAIFETLVTEKWPVIFQNRYILTYYIGFWLPPAVIGKIFNSIVIGYFAQFIWAILGVFLSVYYVIAIFKKKLLIPLIIFIAFSGLDILGSIIIDLMNGVSPFTHSFNMLLHLEWYFPGFQFSSFITQLYWVFNQAIPTWLTVMLLLHQKNNKSLLFIYFCLFLFSTLPAVGLFPILVYLCLKNGENDIKIIFTKSHFFNSVKSLFSFSNMVGIWVIMPILFLYLSNNISVGNISVTPISMMLKPSFIFSWFFLFFMLEVSLYFVCVWGKYKRDPMFYIVLLSLLIYPFIHVDTNFDFCMRATIPALIILYLYIVSLFYDKTEKNNVKNQILKTFVIILLVIGSITPIHEIYRSVYWTIAGKTKIPLSLNHHHFWGYTDSNLFLKYFGK